jgi:hypothetical protein
VDLLGVDRPHVPEVAGVVEYLPLLAVGQSPPPPSVPPDSPAASR